MIHQQLLSPRSSQPKTTNSNPQQSSRPYTLKQIITQKQT